jgi:hypothetical protein
LYKTEINHIIDNQIKFEVSLHFWGYSLLCAVVVVSARARVFSKIVTKAKTLSKKKMLSLQIHGYQGNINKLGNLQIMIPLMSNAK